MGEVRATHEVVKSEKVIGRANPISRGFRKLKNSIVGVGGGCFMVILGIIFVILAVKVVPNTSKIVSSLNLLTPEEAEGENNKLVKVASVPDIVVPAKLEYKIKDDYGFVETHTFNKDVVFLDAKFQIYEQKEKVTNETRTVVKDGKDVEQTIEKREIIEDWVTKKEIKSFAVFKLGNIEVETKNIDTKFDTQEFEVDDVVIEDGITPKVYENPSSKVGDTRLVINYVDADDELIVVGKIHNGKIRGGEVFMVTNMDDDALIKSLKSEESIMKWGIRFLAWLFLTIGFSAIVGPILTLVNFIPLANKVTGCVTFVVFGTLSAIIVFVITFVVQYWLLIILCVFVLLAILAGLGIYATAHKKVSKKG